MNVTHFECTECRRKGRDNIGMFDVNQTSMKHSCYHCDKWTLWAKVPYDIFGPQ